MEISAQELRIGNLVYYRDKLKVLTVDNIGSKGFSTLDENGLEYGSDDVSEYNGIELTEDWLLKMEFILNENYEHPSFDEFIHSDFEYFGIGNFNDEYWIIDFLDQSFGSQEIKYVHQLQNLFYCLCGEELQLTDK